MGVCIDLSTINKKEESLLQSIAKLQKAVASAKPLSPRWASWRAVEGSTKQVGAFWLSLQNYLRFVLTFPVHCAAGLGEKNTPLVSQRGFKDDSILFSVP